MILHETDYLKVVYEDDIPGLIITWKGFTTSEEFCQGVDVIMNLMAARKITKTLTDLTEHRVISAEDQEYAAQRSIQFSHENWEVKRAIITPKDVFTRFGIKQVNSAVAKEVSQKREFFSNQAEAIHWLKTEP